MADEQLDAIKIAGNSLVFISHDTRDADLAEAFSNLLKSVSAGVLKSFRTTDRRGNQGIEFGVEWYPEIIRNIQGASDVVCLLTKRSVDRPWILFEAGMAKGKLDTPILGVAVGIELKDASYGPFAQFQNCGDDEDSLTKLVFQLVDRIPNSEPDIDTIRFQVGKFKQAANEILKKIDKDTGSEANGHPSVNVRELENSSAKLFEEIKIMFQDLPSRIERASPTEPRKRKRRLRPEMLEKFMHFSNDPTVALRICLSLYRDKMPWIYEEGITLISSLESAKSPIVARKSFDKFKELLIKSTRTPFFEDYLVEDKEEYMLFMEMTDFLLRNIQAASRI